MALEWEERKMLFELEDREDQADEGQHRAGPQAERPAQDARFEGAQLTRQFGFEELDAGFEPVDSPVELGLDRGDSRLELRFNRRNPRLEFRLRGRDPLLHLRVKAREVGLVQ